MEEDTTISGCDTNDADLSVTSDLETVQASNVKHPAPRHVTFSPRQKIMGDSARESAEDAPSLEDIEAIVRSFLDDNGLHRSDREIEGLVVLSEGSRRTSDVPWFLRVLSHHLDDNQELARELYNRLRSTLPTSVPTASSTSASSSLTESRTRDDGSTAGTVNETEAPTEGARVPVQQENPQGMDTSATGSSSTLIGESLAADVHEGAAAGNAMDRPPHDAGDAAAGSVGGDSQEGPTLDSLSYSRISNQQEGS